MAIALRENIVAGPFVLLVGRHVEVVLFEVSKGRFFGKRRDSRLSVLVGDSSKALNQLEIQIKVEQTALTFGVMTTIVLVLTSIQSFCSNVNGSLAIMMMFSLYKASHISKPAQKKRGDDIPLVGLGHPVVSAFGVFFECCSR
jgi:hypothetical protein